MNDKLIMLGDKRILLSSIKEYGISKRKLYFEKVFEAKPGFVGSIIKRPRYILTWRGETVPSSEQIANHPKICPLVRYLHDREKLTRLIGKRDTNTCMIVEEEKCLYLTTSQGDKLVFGESEATFDLEAKCREIDEIFNNQPA